MTLTTSTTTTRITFMSAHKNEVIQVGHFPTTHVHLTMLTISMHVLNLLNVAVGSGIIAVAAGTYVSLCSAGVGRTGTYIALDTLFRHIEHAAQQQQQQVQQPTIDVFGIVYRMRMNRVMMVQTEVPH